MRASEIHWESEKLKKEFYKLKNPELLKQLNKTLAEKNQMLFAA